MTTSTRHPAKGELTLGQRVTVIVGPSAWVGRVCKTSGSGHAVSVRRFEDQPPTEFTWRPSANGYQPRGKRLGRAACIRIIIETFS